MVSITTASGFYFILFLNRVLHTYSSLFKVRSLHIIVIEETAEEEEQLIPSTLDADEQEDVEIGYEDDDWVRIEDD